MRRVSRLALPVCGRLASASVVGCSVADVTEDELFWLGMPGTIPAIRIRSGQSMTFAREKKNRQHQMAAPTARAATHNHVPSSTAGGSREAWQSVLKDMRFTFGNIQTDEDGYYWLLNGVERRDRNDALDVVESDLKDISATHLRLMYRRLQKHQGLDYSPPRYGHPHGRDTVRV